MADHAVVMEHRSVNHHTNAEIQPHAWYSKQSNLCFEEYIQFLKNSGGYTAEIDGAEYAVLYEIPHDGIIYVPEGRNYNISSDNTDGYIVTSWE